MRFDAKQAYELLSCIDPGRVRSGKAVGLRDGALLALIAAGLSAVEIADLQASAITMVGSKLVIAVNRQGLTWSAPLPMDLGARLLAWLTESRLWALPEPVFRGPRGPLTPVGICAVLRRYWHRQSAPASRKRKLRRRSSSTRLIPPRERPPLRRAVVASVARL